MTIRYGSIIFAAVLPMLVSCAEVPPPVTKVLAPEIPAQIGYIVIDLADDKVLAAREPDRLFIPASTVKLLTTFTALRVLGPDYRFQTAIQAAGQVRGDTVTGDLVLVGGGDPLLGYGDLMGLATRLHDLGIRRVDGRFLYDETWAPAIPAIDADQPIDAPYNAGVGALSLNFNRSRLTWPERADGKAAMPFMTPPVSDAASPGLLRSPAPEGMNAHWDGERWLANDGGGDGGSAEVPVRKPGLATALIFRAIAGSLGLDLPTPEPGKSPPEAVTLARLASAPLADVARQSLEYSNNVVAELIGLATARATGVEPPVPASSATQVSALLRGWMPDTDWNGFHLANLSGLSAASRVTPRQMVNVLRYADARRFGGWPFRALLPTAGQQDAFRRRFRGPATALRVWAKSGTMNYASGLVGYLLTAKGRRLAFALYAGDGPRRRAYDADPARQSSTSQRRARAWTRAAEANHEALVTSWLSTY